MRTRKSAACPPPGPGIRSLEGESGREQGYLKTIRPKSAGQAALLEAMDQRNLVLALGPAGTGKTYLAIAKAVEALEAGKVGRIVLSRPAVEAGKSLGYLPGELEDKLAPYLRPLYDALSDRLSMKRVRGLITEGAIEIAPVGFMRGRTLNNAFVVIDEAQNCTYVQLKMLLTRLGWNSTMVVTGDPGADRSSAGSVGLGDGGGEARDAAERRRGAPRGPRHRPPSAGRGDARGFVGRRLPSESTSNP